MKIANGFKSAGFTAAAICFVMAASSVSAKSDNRGGRRFDPRMERSDDNSKTVNDKIDENKVIKEGKVTELKLDSATNKISAIVTLGTLNKPESFKKGEPKDSESKDSKSKDSEPKPDERPEIITLGNETMKIVLDENVKIVSLPHRDAHEVSDNRNGKNECDCGKNVGPNRMPKQFGKMDRNNNRPMPEKNADGAKVPEPENDSLKIGELVRLVLSEDGSKVEAILPILPPRPRPRG